MVKFGDGFELRQFRKDRANLVLAAIDQEPCIGAALGNARQTRQRRRRTMVSPHGVDGNAYHAAIVFRWPVSGGISAKCGENSGFVPANNCLMHG